MTREHEPQRRSEPPLKMVADALTTAANGISPYQQYGDSTTFRTTLLGKLHLDTPNKDGLGLMQRFVDERHIIKSYKQSLTILKDISMLLSDALDEQANPQQELLGADLAAIAIRQFEREKEVCPGVAMMIMLAPQRFLADAPGMKERVFEKGIDQVVTNNGGRLEEGRMFSHNILNYVGLIPPEDDNVAVPSGKILFEDESGELIELPPIKAKTFSERDKNEFLASSEEFLELLWIQKSEDSEPHKLIQIPSKRRRLRRLRR